MKQPIIEETTTAEPPRPELKGKSDCIYKSNPKDGLITFIVALIRSKGHFSEFKNSSRLKYNLLIFRSAESIFNFESFLLDNEQ